jgi:hypothetical protein
MQSSTFEHAIRICLFDMCKSMEFGGCALVGDGYVSSLGCGRGERVCLDNLTVRFESLCGEWEGGDSEGRGSGSRGWAGWSVWVTKHSDSLTTSVYHVSLMTHEDENSVPG